MATERYQLQEKIAQGDFATVYRAYDHELKRDVAVKQIHQQYLSDPRQLDRYWQEAQLLASLEHPHVTTIYDIVRERGWLVLELMQGSLSQLLDGHAIDLNDLRLAITFTLHGLQFMHDNGIVHGDVKPSNLLVDRNNRVKLGDFGIARRLSGDDGSVVKGTTKYIAPEVVSDQFGEVGPHSDLYSLGFSAFDLMCGENFDSLFPGLNMYGRDQQIAWMMWHSAADRRLPEVQKVLDGVPDDLAFIVQRLTEKDPQRRYQTAQQVIDDLNADGPLSTGPTPEEIAAAEKAERQAKQKRIMLIGAVAVSMLLSVGMLFMGNGDQPKKATNEQKIPEKAVMLLVDLEHQRFLVRPENGKQFEIKVDDKSEVTILLNDQVARLEQLRGGDRLTLQASTMGDGKRHLQIRATRPTGKAVEGGVVGLNAVERWLAISTAGGEKIQLHVPSSAKITLNGLTKTRKGPIGLGDLQPDDRVSLTYFPGQSEKETSVTFDVIALRQETLNGFINGVDRKNNLMTLRYEQARGGKEKSLPIAKQCKVTLNGRPTLNGQPITVADLLADDEVEVRHDDQIHVIVAKRSFEHTGLVKVVTTEGDVTTLQLTIDGKDVAFLIEDSSEVKLAGEAVTDIPIRYIRPGDQLRVRHESPDLQKPVAKELLVQPRPDKRIWVLLIAQQKYDDSRITQLPHIAKDTVKLQNELTGWYRVPSDQFRLEMDVTKRELMTRMASFLGRVPQDAILSVFYLGNGYRAKTASVLATRDTQFDNLASTGVKLRDFFDAMEACKASKKLLFLDSAHSVSRGIGGKDRQLQPSSAALAESLRPTPKRPISKSVAVITSCAADQKGLRGADGSSLFCSVLAEAFSGKADTDRNFDLSAQELFTFAQREVSARLTARQRQTPLLFAPDDSPTRLSKEAQDAIRKVLSYLDDKPAIGLDLEFENAKAQAPNDPEPTLAYAMVQLKRGKRFDSLRSFQKLVKRHPKCVLGYHGLSHQYFLRHDYAVGIRNVNLMVKQLEIKPGSTVLQPLQRQLLEYAGILREYAAIVPTPQRSNRELGPIDSQVAAYGKVAQRAYEDGRARLASRLKSLDSRISRAKTAKNRTQYQRDRKRIGTFVKVDYQAIRAHLLRLIME